MSRTRYPLATSTWDDAELEAARRVLDSGRTTMGAEVRRFEQDFAALVGSRFAVMVNSGSSANLLAVAASTFRSHGALRPRDEVIVPAVSWPTTYYPLAQYGLRLRFVDIDRDTLNMDLDRVAEALTPRTRAVFAVNLLGNPNDFDRLRSIIGGRDVLLLEDNCESLGASLGGRSAGTFGVMGTFSTFFSHHMSTMEGGVVVTDDEELYHILLSLRAHGWTRDLPEVNLVTGRKDPDPFRESFRFVLPGYNVRPLEIEGAIGQEQLKKLPRFIEARRRNAVAFREAMSDLRGVTIQREVGESSWFGFSMLFDRSAVPSRHAVIEQLRADGIECRPIVAGNFCRNPVIRFLDHDIVGDLRVADEVSEWGLFVGNHHFDMQDEFLLLRDSLRRVFR